MRYKVVAHAEDGLPHKEVEIIAKTREQAWDKAWETFPEYHLMSMNVNEEEEDAIQELAFIIGGKCDDCTDCLTCSKIDGCGDRQMAEYLYREGYRKEE